MKITSIEIIKLKRLAFSSQTPVLCKINTDEGIYGYGEAGVSINDFTVGSFEILKLFSKMLIGKDPMDHEAIYTKLTQTFWAEGNGGVIMSAISALDTALWDIKGKAFNVPVYKLLGGKQREKLRCYASQLQNGWKYHDFITAPGDLGFIKDACQSAVDDGYDAIKIDFINKRLDGRGVDRVMMKNYIPKELMKEFEARLQTARDAVGDDIEIILENHCLTSLTSAVQFAHVAEPYDIMFYEEPAGPLNPQEYKLLSERTSIPLATGERSYTRWGYLPFLKDGSLSVVQPDLGNCGGITEGKKICDLAHTFAATVQTHTCNTPISIAASLHLEIAIPNFIIHEHHTVDTLPDIAELCIYDYQPVDGYYSVPEIPGIGNELSEKALKEAEIFTVK